MVNYMLAPLHCLTWDKSLMDHTCSIQHLIQLLTIILFNILCINFTPHSPVATQQLHFHVPTQCSPVSQTTTFAVGYPQTVYYARTQCSNCPYQNFAVDSTKKLFSLSSEENWFLDVCAIIPIRGAAMVFKPPIYSQSFIIYQMFILNYV